LKQLVDGHFTGLEMLREGATPEAIEAIARRESLTVDRLHEVLTLLHQPNKEENVTLLSPGPQGLEGTIEKIGQFLARKGVIDRPRTDHVWTDARLCQP